MSQPESLESVERRFAEYDENSSHLLNHVDFGFEEHAWRGPVKLEFVEFFFFVLYALVFIGGILMNSLILIAVWRNKHLRTVTNLLIVNLATADLWLNIFDVPFMPISVLEKSWIFGKAMCFLVTMAYSVYKSVWALTLSVIAVNRYFIYMMPSVRKMSMKLIAAVLLTIWWVASFLGLPVGMQFYYKRLPIKDEQPFIDDSKSWDTHCFQIPESLGLELVKLFVQYVVPFVVMLCFYPKLWLSIQRNSAGNGNGNEQTVANANKHKRTVLALVSVSVYYFVRSLPQDLLEILGDHSIVWYATCHFLAIAGTVINPVFYLLSCANFNEAFVRLLCCRRLEANLQLLENEEADNSSERAEAETRA